MSKELSNQAEFALVCGFLAFFEDNLVSESDHDACGEISPERTCEGLIVETTGFAENSKYVETDLLYEASVCAAV